jgi:Tol biopolymer transport system component
MGRLVPDTCDGALSKDGRKVVFSRRDSCDSGYDAIFVHDLVTGEEAVVPGSCGLTNPSWSPDGNSIIASSTQDAKIYIIPSTGGEPALALCETFSNECWDAQWSPDGANIAYYTTMPGSFIKVAPATCITTLGGCDQRAKTLGTYWQGYAWSPDGKRIAALRPDTDGSVLLDVLDVASGSAQVLRREPACSSASLAWSPDGNWLAFSCNDNFYPLRARLLPLSGGQEEAMNLYLHELRLLFWLDMGT